MKDGIRACPNCGKLVPKSRNVCSQCGIRSEIASNGPRYPRLYHPGKRHE